MQTDSRTQILAPGDDLGPSLCRSSAEAWAVAGCAPPVLGGVSRNWRPSACTPEINSAGHHLLANVCVEQLKQGEKTVARKSKHMAPRPVGQMVAISQPRDHFKLGMSLALWLLLMVLTLSLWVRAARAGEAPNPQAKIPPSPYFEIQALEEIEAINHSLTGAEEPGLGQTVFISH